MEITRPELSDKLEVENPTSAIELKLETHVGQMLVVGEVDNLESVTVSMTDVLSKEEGLDVGVETENDNLEGEEIDADSDEIKLELANELDDIGSSKEVDVEMEISAKLATLEAGSTLYDSIDDEDITELTEDSPTLDDPTILVV